MSGIFENSSWLFQPIVDDTNKNQVFSSLSIRNAFSLLFPGLKSGEPAFDQLKRSLAMKSSLSHDQIYAGFTAIQSSIAAIKSSGNAVLTLGNRVVIDSKIPVSQSFKDALVKQFHADVEIKGSNNQALVDKLNKWIATETHDKITSLVTVSDVASADFLIVNAIYFKASWKEQFAVEHTYKTEFVVFNGPATNVDMMFKRFKQMHIRNFESPIAADFIRLPYENPRFSMICMLPTDSSEAGFRAIAKSGDLTTTVSDFVEGAVNGLLVEVNVNLPKFKVKLERFDLIPSMKSRGAVDIFCNSKCPIKLDASAQGLFVSKTLHTAVLEVDEMGSEAAASTMVVMSRGMTFAAEFKANRPFFVWIWDHELNLPLFSAQIIDPSK